jgi:thiol-disulfide isomerase/thioredoxin
MNPINFLSTNDFQTAESKNGLMLKNKIKGFSFVMFYSNQCSYSRTITPFFKELANKFPGTIFAMVDISRNLNVVHASKNTNTPIQYVPLLIFYNEGVPLFRYEGPTDQTSYEKLFEFLREIHQNLSNSNTRKFHSAQEQPSGPPPTQIPPYLICKPHGDDPEGVCFLNMDVAYKK